MKMPIFSNCSICFDNFLFQKHVVMARYLNMINSQLPRNVSFASFPPISHGLT